MGFEDHAALFAGVRGNPSRLGIVPAAVDDLLDKRLLFVTGKGGVGRSTVATALGLVAARRGLRTMLAEVAGQDRVSRSLGREGAGFEEVELEPRLFHLSVDPQHALEEYLRLQMPARPMADLLGSSRMFQYLAAATPGMRELLTMGKIWELAQLQRRTRGASAYDLVIVDAPATGHGLAILRAPKTFADVARVGPIARQARTIQGTLCDPRATGVIAVAVPEEMAVAEALSLCERLGEPPELPLAAVVVNELHPDRFSSRHSGAVTRALEHAGSPAARAALRAALSARRRATREQAQVRRLRGALEHEPVLLPFVFPRDGERAVFEALSGVLERSLAVQEAAA